MSEFVEIKVDRLMTIGDLVDQYSINNMNSFYEQGFGWDDPIPAGTTFRVPVEHIQGTIPPEMSPEPPSPTPVIREVVIDVPPAETLWASNRDDVHQYMWDSAGNTGEYDQPVVAMAIQDSGTQWLNNAIDVLYFYDERTQEIPPDSMLRDALALFDASLSPEERIQAVSQLISYDFDALSQAFREYQTVFPELVHSELDFHQYMMLHEHWRLTEQGLESPYAPMFQPDYGTETLMYSTMLDPNMKDMTDEERQQYLMTLMTIALDQSQLEALRRQDGSFPEDLTNLMVPEDQLTEGIYATIEMMYGPDYTTADVAEYINDLSFAMLGGEPLPRPLQDFVLDAFNASQAYLRGNQIDQARAIVQSWDDVEAGKLLEE